MPSAYDYASQKFSDPTKSPSRGTPRVRAVSSSFNPMAAMGGRPAEKTEYNPGQFSNYDDGTGEPPPADQEQELVNDPFAGIDMSALFRRELK